MSVPIRFIDRDEVEIVELDNGYINNILSGEGFLSEHAVVTNKRMYYSRKSGLFWRVVERDLINVEDITAVKILRSKSFVFTLLGLLGAGCLVYFKVSLYWILAFLSVVLGAILDIILSKHYLSIEYAGGHIRFSVRIFEMEQVAQFQDGIIRAKTYEAKPNEAEDASKAQRPSSASQIEEKKPKRKPIPGDSEWFEE